MVKKNAELFTDAEYKKNVRNLGDDYLSRTPRPVAAYPPPPPAHPSLLSNLSTPARATTRLRSAALIQATSARLPGPTHQFIRGGRVVWRAGAEILNGGGAEAASGV